MKQKTLKRLLSLMLSGCMTAGCAAFVQAQEDGILIDEHFEISESDIGMEALGYNGWGEGYSKSTSTINVEDSIVTIEREPGHDSNEVLKLYRPTSSSKSVMFRIKKELDREYSEEILKLSFRLQKASESASMFRLCLVNSDGGNQDIIYDMKKSYIVFDSAIIPFIGNNGSNPASPINVWHNFEILIDTGNRTASFYQDGKLLAENAAMASSFNGKVKYIGIGTHRTAAGAGAIFYADDVVLEKLSDMALVSASPENGGENIAVEGKIELNFSNSVDKDSLSGITVSGMNVDDIEIDSTKLSKVYVKLAGDFDYDTLYTVNISGVKDIYGRTAPEESITFRTKKRSLRIEEPRFYTDYTSSKNDITDSGLIDGKITAEVAVRNETLKEAEVLLLAEISGSEGKKTVAKTYKFDADDSSEKKLTLDMDAKTSDTVRLFVLDGWSSLTTVTGEYIFDDRGISSGEFAFPTAAEEINTSIDYENQKLIVSGSAENRNSDLVLIVISPDYSKEDLRDENADSAIMEIKLASSDENADYKETLDLTGYDKDTLYTIVASGGTENSFKVYSATQIQEAIGCVTNSSSSELAALLIGSKPMENGILLNNILGLDLSEYMLLRDYKKVLDELSGKSYTDLEELRTEFNIALKKQVEYEKEMQIYLDELNAALYEEIEELLSDKADEIGLDLEGEYKSLNKEKKTALLKSLEKDYKFVSYNGVRNAFETELARQLSTYEEIPEESKKIFFEEGFDFEDGEEGRGFTEWNGWSGGYGEPSGTVTVRDSEYTLQIDPDDSTNKVLQLYRPTSTDSSIGYTVEKTLEKAISDGVAVLSFRIKRTNDKTETMRFCIKDHKGTNWDISIDLKRSIITCGQAVKMLDNTGANVPTTLNKWYSFEIFFNILNKTVAVYQDGACLASDIPFLTGFEASLQTIGISTSRKAAGNGANFILDDVSLSKIGKMEFISSNPSDKAENVEVDSQIVLLFNHPVNMNSVSTSNVLVNGEAADYVKIHSENEKKLIAGFNEPFEPGKTYDVLVTGVKDAYSQVAKDKTFSFTTRGKKLNFSEPVFYTDYESEKKPVDYITAVTKSITAEFETSNETGENKDIILIANVWVDGKSRGVTAKKYSVNAGEEGRLITVSSDVEIGGILNITAIDSFTNAVSYMGIWNLSSDGIGKNLFDTASASERVHAAVYYDSGELEITGISEKANATVSFIIFNPGYSNQDVSENNAHNAVYAVIQAVADKNGKFTATLDISETEKNKEYTLIASGGKSASFIYNDVTSVNAAVSAVNSKSEDALLGMLLGEEKLTDTLLLNDVLQLDLTDFVTLLENEKVLSSLTGKGFNDIEAIRSAYNTALASQVEYEKRVKEALLNINNAQWDSIEKELKNASDVLTLSWTGEYLKLEDHEKVSMYKILAKDYNFTTLADAISAFDKEIAKQLENRGNQPSGGGAGGGGFSGGGETKKYEYDEPVKVPDAANTEVKFTDIEKVPWAKESIEALCDKGIINGVGEKRFAPNNGVKREEFVKMIVLAFNLSGSTDISFDDVENDAWYKEYISVAVNNGIIKGVSENNFGTGNYILRKDIAVICARIAEKCNIHLPKEDKGQFSDENIIPDYAKESAAILRSAGIMSGDSNNCFAPLNNATRAEAAAIIYRLLGYVTSK